MALKVGVIGAGNIGRHHARYHNESPNAELVCICDVIPEKAKALADQYKVRAYSNVDEMLRNEDLDIISVATAGPENGGHHYEPVMQSLEAGKHVLVEKPISNNIEQAREMVAAARRKGVQLGVDLNHRFVPLAERAKRFITDGDLGMPLFCNMVLWIRNPNESSPWFHFRALHPHSIDVMRYMCGEIVKVQAFALQSPGRKIWSTLSMNMQFASGAVGHLTGSYDMTTIHPIERCEVGGTKGRFVLENVFETLTFYPHTSPETIVLHNSIMGGVGSFNETFKNRIFRFDEQIAKGEAVDGSGVEGLAAQEVIEAAIQSLQNGTVVDVPKIAE